MKAREERRDASEVSRRCLGSVSEVSRKCRLGATLFIKESDET